LLEKSLSSDRIVGGHFCFFTQPRPRRDKEAAHRGGFHFDAVQWSLNETKPTFGDNQRMVPIDPLLPVGSSSSSHAGSARLNIRLTRLTRRSAVSGTDYNRSSSGLNVSRIGRYETLICISLNAS
jgi:hypothetical protein